MVGILRKYIVYLLLNSTTVPRFAYATHKKQQTRQTERVRQRRRPPHFHNAAFLAALFIAAHPPLAAATAVPSTTVAAAISSLLSRDASMRIISNWRCGSRGDDVASSSHAAMVAFNICLNATTLMPMHQCSRGEEIFWCCSGIFHCSTITYVATHLHPRRDVRSGCVGGCDSTASPPQKAGC